MKAIIVVSCALPFLLAACSSYPHPREIQASNPTVTYAYRGDRELLQANQNASAFCGQYSAVPRTVRIDETSEGRAVVFECIPAGAVPYQ